MLKSAIKSALKGVALLVSVAPHGAHAAGGSAYDFSFQTLVGNQALPMTQFQGKVVLVVNTASECGFTPQYKGLEALYQKYRDRGLVVLGVPSNDFGAQEPGGGEKIASFCQKNFGVTFPMAAKEIVKGDEAHPFYRWTRAHFGFAGAPKWNFHKYLIDRHGNLVDYFHTTTSPDASNLVRAIESSLDG